MAIVEQTKTPTESAPAIVCRPNRVYWIFAFFGLFFGLGFWLAAHSPTKNGPPSPGEVLFWQTAGVSCVIAAILPALWVGRTRIIADQAGLRWRRFGGWKYVGWGEVQDYYDRLSGQGQIRGAGARVIKTATGSVGFGWDWVGSKPLREAVEQQATATATHEWGLLGTRPCDPWPRVFGYDTFSNCWSPRLLVKLLLMFVVYGLVQPALSLTGWAALLGWRMTLTTAALYLLLILPLVAMLVKSLLDYRAVQKRIGERITLTPAGLVFEDGTRRVDARWDEVTGYGIVGTGKYAVETGGGAFDFLGSIGNRVLLCENIRQYADQSADTEWKTRVDAETLGGEAARWSGGQVGVGARVFHYRTRSYRMMLLIGLFAFLLTGALTAVSILSGPVSPPGGYDPVAVVLGGLTAAFGAYWLLLGWGIYRWGSIHLDEDGLTQRTPLGRTRILWAQVRDFRPAKGGTNKNGGIIEANDGRRIHFGVSIVGREELMAEIVRRAVGCGRAEWQKRSPA